MSVFTNVVRNYCEHIEEQSVKFAACSQNVAPCNEMQEPAAAVAMPPERRRRILAFQFRPLSFLTTRGVWHRRRIEIIDCSLAL